MDEHHTPLSKQQLVQLIRSLILVEQVPVLAIHASVVTRFRSPHAQCDLKYRCVASQSHEPRILASGLKYLQEDLQLKKANVYRSIPYWRLGSNRDARCYRKAYPHLVAFKVSIGGEDLFLENYIFS